MLCFGTPTQCSSGAVGDHESWVESPLVDEEGRQLAQGGVTQPLGPPLTDRRQLMDCNGQKVESLREKRRAVKERRTKSTANTKKTFVWWVTNLCWIFSMEISTWNGFTSFRKHHLVQLLRKWHHKLISSENPTHNLWQNLNCMVDNCLECSEYSGTLTGFLFAGQRRIQGCQWHCWFRYWWCSGQIWLCRWRFREPVHRKRRLCSRYEQTTCLNSNPTWSYLRTASHGVGILDSVAETVALWKKTPPDDKH